MNHRPLAYETSELPDCSTTAIKKPSSVSFNRGGIKSYLGLFQWSSALSSHLVRQMIYDFYYVSIKKSVDISILLCIIPLGTHIGYGSLYRVVYILCAFLILWWLLCVQLLKSFTPAHLSFFSILSHQNTPSLLGVFC